MVLALAKLLSNKAKFRMLLSKSAVVGVLAALPATYVVASASAEVVDGTPAWFTAEQAERGEARYNSNCAECHGEELIQVIAGWPNAGGFFGFISSQMPIDRPGALPMQTYADIVAYLLSANGFPAGDEELPPDPAVMQEVQVRDALTE